MTNDEIILNSFNRNKTANQASQKKSVQNLNVRNENIKKTSKKKRKKTNPKLVLKKAATTALATLVLAGGGTLAAKIYRDVKVPVGFDYSGTSISSTRTLPDEIEDDFILIEVNS